LSAAETAIHEIQTAKRRRHHSLKPSEPPVFSTLPPPPPPVFSAIPMAVAALPPPARVIAPPRLEFPLKRDAPLSGMIFHLTNKHNGNVHKKGIINFTSSSISGGKDYALENIVDFDKYTRFWSVNKHKPGEWACWDFKSMRVCPTAYTLHTMYLKTWIVESSMDGAKWTLIDKQEDNRDFAGPLPKTASFSVRNSAECRFIRLTQTASNHCPLSGRRTRDLRHGVLRDTVRVNKPRSSALTNANLNVNRIPCSVTAVSISHVAVSSYAI
jgi:hypothetical protein